ncbi:MAG: RNB domain-containing ribonuclease [Parachlamydiaceae bacterium]
MQTSHNTINLTELAKESLIERRLLPDFPSAALKEANQMREAAQFIPSDAKDMRHLLWFSLDNDDSRDLDQITYAEMTTSSSYKIYVAIADVDSLVKKDSPIDLYAQQNTTSIYTPTKIFPMLPEKLSTNLTSLNENEDRLAIIVEVDIDINGAQLNYTIYRAYVRNKAKLAYNGVSDWLDDLAAAPDAVQKEIELDRQIRLQDKIATILRHYRHQKGALTLQTIEPYPVFDGQTIIDLRTTTKNRGRNLIEDFMISANQATANFLKNHRQPSFRRVVRIPKRWNRIIDIAKEYKIDLPPDPDAIALDQFLKERCRVDPLHFPDLSLTIIKLLGNGEYVVEYPDESPIGHFSLAVTDYTHSTAPNRRFPDLITQRLIKSILDHQPSPYSNIELEKLARQCTEKEDDVQKVERKMKKSAACLLLFSKINQEFDALVTGSGPKGTWVRVMTPPVDGKLIKGFENLDVGDKIRVKLIHVDVQKGFIDFIRI